MWDELGINPTADPKAIRRAYAARLKTLDPDRDPQAFTRLRTALEQALAGAAHPSSVATNARLATDEDDRSEAPDRTMEAVTKDVPIDIARPIDHRPAGERDAAPDWTAASAADHALLDELDNAIISCDGSAAIRLYSRAAATGAIPLRGETRLLDRVMSIAVEDKTIDDVAFREFVDAFGCDQSISSDAQCEIHRRVLTRLVAADWYRVILATADRRKGETRKQARLARLVLGRIGRYWMPGVDRAALKSRLDEYHVHQSWLSDRIDPAWVRTLEVRLRRREVAGILFSILLLGGLLLNAVVVLGMEAFAGTSSIAVLPVVLMIVVFLGGVLTALVKSLLGLSMPPPVASDQNPPDDQEARLRWLEQQAELAYEAMYDATPGSALAARYSDAKEFLYDAIALARRLGNTEKAEHLSRRLAEIKTVFRTQFPG